LPAQRLSAADHDGGIRQQLREVSEPRDIHLDVEAFDTARAHVPHFGIRDQVSIRADTAGDENASIGQDGGRVSITWKHRNVPHELEVIAFGELDLGFSDDLAVLAHATQYEHRPIRQHRCGVMSASDVEPHRAIDETARLVEVLDQVTRACPDLSSGDERLAVRAVRRCAKCRLARPGTDAG
jgi:hypothetical protein